METERTMERYPPTDKNIIKQNAQKTTVKIVQSTKDDFLSKKRLKFLKESFKMKFDKRF